jgi:hypothetical protein
MTFLAPITGIITGVLGLGTLAVLYLLKLRRRTLRVGSTLLWQEAASDLQVNVPFRWLRSSWLLLLHSLLILLLAAALGRPTAELPGPGADRIYIVIDRSASMNAPANADPDSPTRLEVAIERALELTTTLRGAPVVSIVTLDARPALAAPPTDLPEPTRDAIRSISPTDQPGDLGAALELIAGLSAGTQTQENPDEQASALDVPVVLFTDANLREPDTVAFPGLRLAIERVDATDVRPPDNLAIADIAVNRDLDDPRIARVFLRLTSTASRELSTVIRVSSNGVLHSTEPVQIPGAALLESGTAPGVGETTHTIRLDEPGTPIITITLDRADALRADNTASVRLSPSASPGILLLAPPASNGDPSPNPDLLDVLTALEPERLVIVSDPAQAAAAARSGTFGIAVLDRVAPDELITIPTISIATLPWAGDLAQTGAPSTVLAWDRTHPALRYVALDGFAIDRPLALPSDAETLTAPGSMFPVRVRELATGSDAPLIAELSTPANRHVVIGFDLAESTWPVHYSFPITLASAVEWLMTAGPSDDGVTNTDRISTADAVTLTGLIARAALDAGRLTGPVEIPIAARDDRAPSVLADADIVTLTPFPRAGLYTVGTGTTPDAPGQFDPDLTLAVNTTNSFESSLTPSWMPDSAAVVDGAAGLRGRAEIWHWFVLAALPLLIIEWLAYARQSSLR